MAVDCNFKLKEDTGLFIKNYCLLVSGGEFGEHRHECDEEKCIFWRNEKWKQ